MGTICAPPYANIFMSFIDDKMKKLATNIVTSHNPIKLFKRFLDDIFLIWRGEVDDLLKFLDQINFLHPTIKFTYSFTCPFVCTYPPDLVHDCFCYSSRSLPFLDTLVTIKENKLVTDIFKKPTDRCQYLLPSSCHPTHVTNNIPYSLCYRLLRICTFKDTLQLRLQELKDLLLSRKYPVKVIDDAISRVLSMERKDALIKKEKNINPRIPFVVTFHRALPSFSKILKNAWNVMIKDEYLKTVFPKPPMVAYRQPKKSSIRSLLVKAKLPEKEKRMIPGMKKCKVKL